MISSVLVNQLPGRGTIYIQQQLSFRAPVTIGDTITATVEVIEVIREKKRVRLKTECTNQKDVVVLDGEALISPPRH
ncbi:MAG: MaoC family dehydratase N-terminal domain-containing protein [Desulfatirhabdiaceae bacterium]